jgi:hypothetical protein
MMQSKIAMAAVMALLFSPMAARADIVTGTFAGTLYDGTDMTGVFETAGSDLMDASVTGTFSYDTGLFSFSVVSGTTNTATGNPGALTIGMTINGTTYTFIDPSSSSVHLDTVVSEITLQSTNTVGSTYETFSLDTSSLAAFVLTTDLGNQNFVATNPTSSTGSFLIADTETSATGDFSLTSITASSRSSSSPNIPEPASAVLLIMGVSGIAAGRIRKARSNQS